MFQKDSKCGCPLNCGLSTALPENAAVITASSQEASLRKRKEEANKTLYIARI
ncbi:MAG: hypothetical protein ACQCN3_06170 [Candidatus Bathyarchaeia archaeon]|jgi:hypothetical protein